MDFRDTSEETQYRAAARKWLSEQASRDWNTSHITDEMEAKYAAAKAYQRERVKAGYGAIALPREFGGGGGTPMEQIIFRQEEVQFNLPDIGTTLGVGLAMCLPTIIHNGTPEQRDRFVKPGILGEEVWCQLFSEPTGGSDVASARTSAVQDSSNWVLQGQKVWTSGAQYSDFGIITTRTDPDVPKHKGLTVFVVDMKAPGIEIRPIRQMSGESEFSEVFFDAVRVPDTYRLGEVNGGWKVALSTLMHERAGIGGKSTNLGWADLLKIAEQLSNDQHDVFANPSHACAIVDSWLLEFGCDLIALRGQTALSRGGQPGPEQSVTKLIKASLLQQNGYHGIDLAGAAALGTDRHDIDLWNKVEHAWMFGAGLRIGGGTDEILRNVVAERVLGLPGDVRLDKDVPFRDVPS